MTTASDRKVSRPVARDDGMAHLIPELQCPGRLRRRRNPYRRKARQCGQLARCNRRLIEEPRSAGAVAQRLVSAADQCAQIGRCGIVGHDTGGGVALIMGIEHPDRVKRLVLANAVAYDSWPIDDMMMLGNPAWRTKTPAEVAEFIASGLPDGLHNAERLTNEFRDGIIAPYSDEEGKISLIRNAIALNTNHTMALVERHKDIGAPTLVLWGVHDPWQTIADGERLSREIPGARLVRLENASHWLQQDVPGDFVREILAFVRGS